MAVNSHLWYQLCDKPEAQATGLSWDVTFGKNEITLERIDVESEYRWQGIASRFISVLCSMADVLKLPIELEVGSGTYETDIVQDLPLFYSRFGFEWDEFGSFMTRPPTP